LLWRKRDASSLVEEEEKYTAQRVYPIKPGHLERGVLRFFLYSGFLRSDTTQGDVVKLIDKEKEDAGGLPCQ